MGKHNVEVVLEVYNRTKQVYDDMMTDLENGVEVHDEVQDMKIDALLNVEEVAIFTALDIVEQTSKEGAEAIRKLHDIPQAHDQLMRLVISILEINSAVKDINK